MKREDRISRNISDGSRSISDNEPPDTALVNEDICRDILASDVMMVCRKGVQQLSETPTESFEENPSNLRNRNNFFNSHLLSTLSNIPSSIYTSATNVAIPRPS